MTAANTLTPKRLNVAALEQKVKAMYRDVALDPHGEFHFEMGRVMAERLGYAPADLDAIPRRRSTRSRGRLLLRPRGAQAGRDGSSTSGAARGWTASSPR